MNHTIFNFLNNSEKHEDGLIEALGGLLPEGQGEDYEEQDFAHKMKKRKPIKDITYSKLIVLSSIKLKFYIYPLIKGRFISVNPRLINTHT